MVKDEIKSALTKIISDVFGRREVNVAKVVVFGSFAKGTETAESDVDIVIVSPSFRGIGIFERVEKATGLGWEIVNALRVPVDLLYYSDLEWDDDRSLIIREAKREGEVIYEAPAAP